MKNSNKDLLESAAAVLTAYVGKNKISAEELPRLIRSVHQAFSQASGEAGSEVAQLKPAVAPRRSVTAEALVCLEDGKTFRSLKKHLQSAHGLSPDEYRVKWGLGPDYPMAAPGYAATRSRLAKQAGFGKSRGRGRGKRSDSPAGATLTDAA